MSLPSAKKLLLSSGAKPGQAAFTTPGTYRWKAPRGVRSVCVACGGAGSGQAGGGGGGLGWKNNIPVVPGQEYLVVVAGVPDVGVAGGDSYFIRADLVCGKGGGSLGGSFVGDGGGKGGDGAGSGLGAGGAGGYTGPGGQGGGGGAAGRPGQGGGGAGGDANMAGGGVGMFGQGASGAGSSAGGSGGEAGTIALGGRFGGGASGRAPGEAYRGGQGFVRILHGANRAFPATKTGDV